MADVEISRISNRAVGYLRRSSDIQDHSIGCQRHEIERFASEEGYTIQDWYIDDAISGTGSSGRAAFLRMIADACRSPRIMDAILVYDVKRFGRMDNDETGYFRHLLNTHGVEIVYVSEGFSGRFEDDLIRPVKQWQARQESRDIAKIVIRGFLAKIRTCKGWWMAGVPPFGYDRRYEDAKGRFLFFVRSMRDMTKQILDRYRRVTRTLESHERLILADTDRCRLTPSLPERVVVVRRIFHDCVVEGMGCAMIADRLNLEGIPSPKSCIEAGVPTTGEWNYSTIRCMLLNPAYAGDLVWNRRTAGKFFRIRGDGGVERLLCQSGKTRFNDPEDWIRIPSAHKPLVDRQVHRLAASLLQERNRCKGRVSPDFRRRDSDYRSHFVLTGLMECSICGGSFHGSSMARVYTGRNPEPYRARIYACTHRKRTKGKRCYRGYVRKRVLERTIALRLTRWYKNRVTRQKRTCFRDEALKYCQYLARKTGDMDRLRQSQNDARVFSQSALQFVERMPEQFFSNDQQVRRLTFRRCTDRVRVDIANRRITIWAKHLPVLGETTGRVSRIYARLPAAREAITMRRKKRMRRDGRNFDFAWLVARKPSRIRELAIQAREMLNAVGQDVREQFHQQYVSYSLGKHFACLKVRRSKLLLYLKADPNSVATMKPNMRDVTGLGTQVTGNLEISIETAHELEAALPLVETAYRRVKTTDPA